MRLAVAGGGARELEAARHLAQLGHAVHTVGLQPGESPDIWRSVAGVIGPVLGTDAGGRALTRPEPPGPLPIDPLWLDQVPTGTPWILGSCGPWLREALAARGLPLRTYAGDDAFARLNSVPTAEGAVAEAARVSGRTAWGSRATVLGCGRCGLALVRTVTALGGCVRAVAADASGRAAAAALGARVYAWEGVERALEGADWVFNTVPAPVLGASQLAATEPGVVVIDIASRPGGTDFAAAERLGRSARLVGGIPERYPVTAGRILAEAALDVLGRHGDGGNGVAGL